MKDEGFANPGGAGPLAGAVLQPLRHLAGRGEERNHFLLS